MKELIKHLVKNNLDRIVERSLLNCHAVGLHSIMLLESPGQTIRLYITVEGNELYKNAPPYYRHGMSVGFHPHHCNLTLHCVKGRIWNWTAARAQKHIPEELVTVLGEYLYRSQITTGQQGFELVNAQSRVVLGPFVEIPAGKVVSLSAKTMHTIACDPFDTAAWLVYEGEEDLDYRPSCFSKSNLSTISTEDLYQKPTATQVLDLLCLVDLLN